MDDYEYDLDEAANDIISQIKNQGKSIKSVAVKHPELTPEEVDDFIRKQASGVIQDAAEVLNNMKDVVVSGCSPNDAIAFAEVLNAFTSAVEILNKSQIAKDKNKTQKEIKVMDINSKKDIAVEDNNTRILLSQNDIIKQMLENSNKDKDVQDNKKASNVIDI